MSIRTFQQNSCWAFEICMRVAVETRGLVGGINRGHNSNELPTLFAEGVKISVAIAFKRVDFVFPTLRPSKRGHFVLRQCVNRLTDHNCHARECCFPHETPPED